ncbi:MAG TPA: response regulator [Gaiellaceae bacterium]|jgi:DNA-binding response OmpR family regulator
MNGTGPDDRPRALVVEDEDTLRELIVVTLGEAFACQEATDGDTALELLRVSPPDLMLLDVAMPGKSGIDVLREMRADPVLQKVPVCVVSAWQSPGDVAKALEAGADRFLAKPFRVDELASIARSLVERRR